MHFLKRTLRRLLGGTEALLSRMYGWKWNPMHQAGTVSALMLLVLVATGLYLVLVYRVGDPAASVARIAADPWLGSWIRSLHRYATDIFVIAAVVHALKMFSQDRSWGPRTLAWISGLVLFGIGMVLAVTGFVMAWDSFGERLARERECNPSARLPRRAGSRRGSARSQAWSRESSPARLRSPAPSSSSISSFISRCHWDLASCSGCTFHASPDRCCCRRNVWRGELSVR